MGHAVKPGWMLRMAFGVQLFGHRLLGTITFALDRHAHVLLRLSTAVPHVAVAHAPVLVHWQVYVTQIGSTGQACCVVGQVVPQNDCAVGVLVVATSTPLLVMYWKQVTARTDETEVGVAVAARQPVGHTLHVPASHRYVRHGETAGQAVVRDTQPVPHATGGTAWPVLARHVAMLVTVPAVPQVSLGQAGATL